MLDVSLDGTTAEILLKTGPVNALTEHLIEELDRAVDRLEKLDLNLVILRSGLNIFCAGADLVLIREFFDKPYGSERMIRYVERLHALFARIEAMRAVSLAVINGSALGGGLELALACDLRLVAADASIGLPEANLGMIPGAGGTQRLTRLCGPAISAQLILSAETISGREAHRLGIANWVADKGDIDTEVAILRERIGRLSHLSLVLSKKCIAAYCEPSEDGYAIELEAPRHTMRSEDTRRRISEFLAHRGTRKTFATQSDMSVGERDAS